jgi:L-ascorbate 6-phosphate lactonase
VPDPAAEVFTGPPSGQAVTLWWLGQSGFVLAAGGLRIAIDPYLSPRESRAVAPACPPEALAGVDAILVTHEHIDHMDLPTLARVAALPPGPALVVPAPVADQALEAGVPIERLVRAQPGDHLRFGPEGEAEVWPLPARHGMHSPPARYDFGHDDSGGLYRYLGYVVRLGGVTLFHSGDGLIYEELAASLRRHGVQVGLLPINGRDHHREARDIVGNMTEREAADLAADAGLETLVPMHYEMFAHNPGEPGRLVEYVRRSHPELTVVLPTHMRGVTLSPVQTAAPGAGGTKAGKGLGG